MTEFREEHRRLVIDLIAISTIALLILGAVVFAGWTALLILALWVSVGTALGFLIGPLFGE